MRIPKSMAPAVREAKRLGFQVTLSRGNHLRFSRPGKRTVFGSYTPSDTRSCKNIIAKIRRAAEDRL